MSQVTKKWVFQFFNYRGDRVMYDGLRWNKKMQTIYLTLASINKNFTISYSLIKHN